MSATSNSVSDMNHSDKNRGIPIWICTIKYNVDSNMFFSKCSVPLICMCCCIYTYQFKLDHIEQDEQNLTGQTQMNSNTMDIISIGTMASVPCKIKGVINYLTVFIQIIL
jgi:hypothetical protein